MASTLARIGYLAHKIYCIVFTYIPKTYIYAQHSYIKVHICGMFTGCIYNPIQLSCITEQLCFYSKQRKRIVLNTVISQMLVCGNVWPCGSPTGVNGWSPKISRQLLETVPCWQLTSQKSAQGIVWAATDAHGIYNDSVEC